MSLGVLIVVIVISGAIAIFFSMNFGFQAKKSFINGILASVIGVILFYFTQVIGLTDALVFVVIPMAVLMQIIITKLISSNPDSNGESVESSIPERVPSGQDEIRNTKNQDSAAKVMQGKNGPANQIFLSYRRDDSSDISGRIYDWLVQHFGEDRVFKDVDSIPLGVDFKKHLDQTVSQCSVLLTVIGTNWLYTNETTEKSRLHDATDFVRIEVESALQRNIPVIPLFVRKATMPSADDLPDSLKSLVYRNGISIRPDPDFHNDMKRLIRAIGDYI